MLGAFSNNFNQPIMKFVPIEKQSNKQIKTHSKKTFKTWKKKLISFVYRSYGALVEAYEKLLLRYKKVEFPILSQLKQSGGLFVQGSFTIWY